jgi:hypothetical protein
VLYLDLVISDKSDISEVIDIIDVPEINELKVRIWYIEVERHPAPKGEPAGFLPVMGF